MDTTESKFISRKDDGVFECSHKECAGIFRVKKPSFGLDLQIERMVGALAGVTPTEDCMLMAEQMAVISMSFDESPKDFDPNKIVRVREIVPELYEEVVAFWKPFRE